MQRNHIITIIGASVAALALGACSTTTSVQPAEQERSIVIRADGKAEAVPDVVEVALQVSQVSDDTEDATRVVAASMEAVREALKEAGVDEERIQTESLYVVPEYRFYQERNEIYGYRATQVVRLVVEEAEEAGTVIDSVIRAGGNTVSILSTNPVVRDRDAARRAAREEAVKKAREEAETYAELLGFELGEVLSVQEVGGGGVYRSMPGRPLADGAEMADTVIDLGVDEVAVSVEIHWAIG